MMRRLVMIAGIAGCLFASTPQAYAVMYDGFLTANGGGLTTNDGLQWDSSDTKFSWHVEWNTLTNPNLWTYAYTFTSPEKQLSHFIIEVSDGIVEDPNADPSFEEKVFTDSNIFPGTSIFNGGGLATYGPPPMNGSSNPNMPSSMLGIKWNRSESAPGTQLEFSFSLITNRQPMWGDVYGKDGKSGGRNGEILYFYNDGFSATDPTVGPHDGSEKFHVLVPDTKEGPPEEQPPLVPEPSSLLLLGTGLAGAFRFTRKKQA